MNAGSLLEHYAQIADAPDAIAKLRRLVLDLAVRGKLGTQKASESVTGALERLVAENAKRVQRASNSKKNSGASGSAIGQLPVPPRWAIVRLGEALQMFNGRAFKPTEWIDEGLPIVRIQNLNNPGAPYNFCDPISVDSRHLIHEGEFLISWSGTPGTSFGAFIWKRGAAALNQHIFRCVQVGDVYSKEFLRLAINSQLDVLIGQAQGGVGLQHVTKGTLESLPLPLPPLEEQHRIVAKVGELMALCDQLEVARTQREATRDRLAAASLARLNTPDPDTFPADARFALDALPALTTRPNQIKQLRQTILNLAVRGKLVRQLASENLALKLVELIEATGRKNTLTLPVDSEAHPYETPPSWSWCRLGALITSGPQNGISPKPTKILDATKAITLTATTRGTFDRAQFKHVEGSFSADSDYWLRDGDLLFQRGNTRDYVGIAAIYDGPPHTFVFPDLIIRVRISELVNLRFIHLACVAPPARGYFSDRASGAQSTMPKINQGILVSLPIPLPPLAEQQRIVTKVDALMALCDQLEASLTTGKTTRSRLLNALLHEALAPVAKVRNKHPRAAVSGYVVSRLASKRNFGRTAHMKYLFLAEARLGMQLGGHYMREAAGPLDTGIYELEKQAQAAGWYTHSVETLASGNEKVSYKPGKVLDAIVEEGIAVLGPARAEMDRLIDLMGGLKTEQVEIIATLFAAWNDAVLDGHAPDDDWIIKEVREHWHVSKQRFAPADLHTWLGWMRQHDVVPLGHPPRTMQQTTMEL
jgi:type I restriction enzyme S subunit